MKNEHQTWHIEKSVSVGHLLTTLALLAGFVVSWAQMNTRIETQNVQIQAVDAKLEREIVRQAEDMQAVRSSLMRIEDRLERMTRN